MRSVRSDDLRSSANSILWSVIAGSFLVVFLFAYIAHFALNAYPRLPAVLGGGAPTHVVLLKKTGDSFSVENTLATATGQAEVYELLLETDKTYVLLPLKPRQPIIILNKETLAGLVVSR
jgi:uncharacterized membrane protein